MKFITNVDWNSIDSSMMVLNVKMWSIQERCGRKPACSSLNLISTAFFSLSISMLQNSLPGIDSKVIPRQLLQSDRSPFFGSLKITPSFQSLGGFSFCQTSFIMVSNKTCKLVVYVTLYMYIGNC
jgi:hypothetical protein